MACYHPLKAWKVGVHDKSGKDKYKITSYAVDFLEFNGTSYVPAYLPPDKTMSTELEKAYFRSSRVITDFIEIPCGHCIGCRLKHSSDWANRCMLEASKYDKNCFITLTYDNDHLPKPIDGSPFSSLVKKDFQDFMKRLRDHIKPHKIRFYACGEYGDKSGRPHYHAIIFNYFPEDAKIHSFNHLGDPLYTSEFLSNVWQHQGYVIIGACSWSSCSYVSRYCTKKLNGPASQFYDDFNIIPEFSLMSRRPGIAREYFEDHFDTYKKTNQFIIPTDKKVVTVNANRYFDSLYQRTDEESYNEYKELKRQKAINSRDLKLSFTDLDYIDYLFVEEANFELATSSLFVEPIL